MDMVAGPDTDDAEGTEVVDHDDGSTSYTIRQPLPPEAT